MGKVSNMDEGIARLVAGLAGTFGALGGGLISGVAAIRGARTAGDAVAQQVRDQAAVEHRQWLRGQRQQAYASAMHAVEVFIAAAETAMFCPLEQRREHLNRVIGAHESMSAACVMVNLRLTHRGGGLRLVLGVQPDDGPTSVRLDREDVPARPPRAPVRRQALPPRSG